MNGKREYIPIVRRGEARKLYVNDILYVTSESRLLHFFTREREYTVYGKLDDICEILPEQFFRLHKSCVINLDRVEEMRDGCIFFDSETRVSTCREKYSQALRTYKEYITSPGGKA